MVAVEPKHCNGSRISTVCQTSDMCEPQQPCSGNQVAAICGSWGMVSASCFQNLYWTTLYLNLKPEEKPCKLTPNISTIKGLRRESVHLRLHGRPVHAKLCEIRVIRRRNASYSIDPGRLSHTWNGCRACHKCSRFSINLQSLTWQNNKGYCIRLHPTCLDIQ